MMLHAGDPIGFADLTDPNWVKHLVDYGRLKENEPQINQSDADAAEAMKKLATNPELMQLLIKLSKSM